MSHVDEGTLHALLDGELAPAEVLEVQTHFATCPACSSRLNDARKLLAETERLVTALDAAALETRADGRARPAPASAPARPAGPPPSRPAAPPPMPTTSPETLVLIPNNPTTTEIRRSRLRVMGWAAGFLIVVGAGALGVGMRNGAFEKKPIGTLKIRPEEFSTPGGSDLPPPRPAPPPLGAPGLSLPPAETTADAAHDTPRNAPAAPTAPAVAATPPAPSPADAGRSAAGASRQPAAAPAPAAKPAQEPAATSVFPSAEDRQVIVERAAKATEELDRERTRERAAAATAALDTERRQSPTRPAPTPAPLPPPVPTLDQRSRIANRIGLDEAARQLGGPLHAIDGMSRQLVGVVSPQLVPGSDTSRAVVRAVYIDRAGRLIFLDQQRARPGQPNLPFTLQSDRSGELRWMAGQVMLVLQGDLPTDSLRLLYRRVR